MDAVSKATKHRITRRHSLYLTTVDGDEITDERFEWSGPDQSMLGDDPPF